MVQQVLLESAILYLVQGKSDDTHSSTFTTWELYPIYVSYGIITVSYENITVL